MAQLKRRTNFYESQEGKEAARLLSVLTVDEAFNTNATYSVQKEKYPTGLIPFVDKHMQYLESHPSVNIEHYISNLRLMIRFR
jgi:hypothetical protein